MQWCTVNKKCAAFTLKGYEFIQNKYLGVGDPGAQSGIVNSPVAGSRLIASGYAGVAVFSPWRSFVVEEV